MKILLILLLISLPLSAAPKFGCGRYVMVGQYSCETSTCLLKVYPQSQSETIFEIDKEESHHVKRLTGKNIRATVTLYHNNADRPKLRFYRQMAMEYPLELGPKAINLITQEKCQ